jgi:hypothetical protein
MFSGPLQLPALGGRVLEQFVRVHSSWRLGSCGGMEDAAVPGRETSVRRRLRGVSVAGFGQLFNSRGQILAPVIFRGGVPDVLLGSPSAGDGSITTSSLLLLSRRLPA